MHWRLDVNLPQDKVKRKSAKGASNLDTIQRVVYYIFSIWKGLRLSIPLINFALKLLTDGKCAD